MSQNRIHILRQLLAVVCLLATALPVQAWDLTVYVSPAEGGSVNTTSPIYSRLGISSNTLITLVAYPNPDYRFSEWVSSNEFQFVNGNTTTNRIRVMSSNNTDVVLYAKFVSIIPPYLYGDWSHTDDGSNVTITGYTGTNGLANVPPVIDGMPVVSIGDYVFSNYPSLTSVIIPDCVSGIGTGAFFNCLNLSSISLPTNTPLTTIRFRSFQNCSSLGAITIPASVTNIEAYAFMGCLGLTNVVFPESLTSLHDLSFFSCSSLTNVFIPASVSFIGTGVFANNDHLLTIVVSPSNQFYSSTNDMLFNKSQTTLIQCPSNKKNALSIPPNVVNVGDFAFGSCSSLTDMIIPNCVTNIGQYAFYSCSSLANMVIPASVVNIGLNAFSWSTFLTSIYFKGNPPAIALPVFDWDNALTVYYYPWTTGWASYFGGRPTQVNPTYTQWLTDYGFATSLTNDYDKDGMFNWQEYLAGTCPTNRTDNLVISTFGGTNTSQISWLAKSNISYQVTKSLDLMGAWSNAPTGIGTSQQAFQTAPMDGVLHYADPDYDGATNGFYRVEVVP